VRIEELENSLNFLKCCGFLSAIKYVIKYRLEQVILGLKQAASLLSEGFDLPPFSKKIVSKSSLRI